MNSIIMNLIFYLLFVCFCSNVSNETTSFDTETLALDSLRFLGDAHVFNQSLVITQDLLVPTSGAGQMWYSKRVKFRQSQNGIPLSFSSNFSLLITSPDPDSNTGDGMAFVISSDDKAVGDAGGNMGVPKRGFAVEFDTRMDAKFEDPNGNHVGLDLGSMVSSHVANLDLYKVDLRSGRPVNAWIDYSGVNRTLDLYISHSNKRPISPVLSAVVDLNDYMNEYMYVGFTASKQGSTEVHSVQRWSFRSSFDSNSSGYSSPLPSPTSEFSSQPTNSSNSDSTITTEKQSKRHSLSGNTIAWIVAAVLVVLAVPTSGGLWYFVKHCSCHAEGNNTTFFCCFHIQQKGEIIEKA